MLGTRAFVYGLVIAAFALVVVALLSDNHHGSPMRADLGAAGIRPIGELQRDSERFESMSTERFDPDGQGLQRTLAANEEDRLAPWQLSLEVVTQGGEGISGASVRGARGEMARTADDGTADVRYSHNDLASARPMNPSSGGLSIEHPGYQSTTVVLGRSVKSTTRTIVMRERSAIAIEVVDELDDSIVDAAVLSVLSVDGGRRHAVYGPSGGAFDILPPTSEFLVAVDAPGYLARRQRIEVGMGDAVVQLRRGRPFEVRVVDGSGKAIRGVDLVMGWRSIVTLDGSQSKAVTDEAGRATLFVAKVENDWLDVSAKLGLRTMSRKLTNEEIAGGSIRIELPINNGTISGRLTTQANKWGGRVTASIWRKEMNTYHQGFGAEFGPDGRFAIGRALAGKRFVLWFYLNGPVAGYSAGPFGEFEHEPLIPGEARLVACELDDLSTVKVKVVNERGDGIAGVGVQAMTPMGSPQVSRYERTGSSAGLTDGDGIAHLVVQNGDRRFVIAPPGHEHIEKSLSISGARELVVALEGAVDIRGAVVDSDGSPIVGALLTLLGRTSVKSSESGSEGKFAFEDVADLRYAITCRMPGGDVDLARLNDISAASGEVVLVVSTGAAMVRLIHHETREPLSGFVAMTRPMVGRTDVLSATRRFVPASGALFEGLPAGSWNIIAALPGYCRATEAIEVLDREQAGVTLVLTRGGKVRFKNLPANFVFSGAVLISEDGARFDRKERIAVADMSIGPFPPGSYYLQIKREKRTWVRSVVIPADSATVEVDWLGGEWRPL